MDTLKDLIADPRILAIMSPVLVSISKVIITKIPKWLMPILSSVFGAVLAALTGNDPGTTGVLAGLAGVGVREVVDQGKKTITG